MENHKITKKDIYLFLKQNKSAVISTVNLENMPEGAEIYYGIDKDFNFYFVTGDKAGLILYNHTQRGEHNNDTLLHY